MAGDVSPVAMFGNSGVYKLILWKLEKAEN